MREDLKNNFVLLSKIAKEKKYAQEYLGLLARRGDIGSIRIGKRWYTTWEWFSEFLENNQKKKETVAEEAPSFEMKEVQAVEAQPMPIEEKIVLKEGKENIAIRSENKVPVQSGEDSFEIKIKNPLSEKIVVAHPSIELKLQETERVVIRKNIERKEEAAIPVRMKSSMPRQNIQLPRERQAEKVARQIPVQVFSQKNNEQIFSQPEFKFQSQPGFVLPAVGANETPERSFFATLAFAASFAMIFFLLGISGYFVFSGGLLEKGKVAGASDERNGGLSGIRSEGNFFLSSGGDKIRESISISRVIVEVAKEKAASSSQ
jgi:hypothetical protein